MVIPESSIPYSAYQGLRPGLIEGLFMMGGAEPPGKTVVVKINGRIGPVVDYQKHAREVLSDSLRGRIWGLLFKDVKRYGAI